MKEEKKDGVAIRLRTEPEELCIIAGSNFCYMYCENWDICESITSPWKKDNEDIHGNDSEE